MRWDTPAPRHVKALKMTSINCHFIFHFSPGNDTVANLKLYLCKLWSWQLISLSSYFINLYALSMWDNAPAMKPTHDCLIGYLYAFGKYNVTGRLHQLANDIKYVVKSFWQRMRCAQTWINWEIADTWTKTIPQIRIHWVLVCLSELYWYDDTTNRNIGGKHWGREKECHSMEPRTTLQITL